MKATKTPARIRVGPLACHVWDGGSTTFFAYSHGERMGRLFSTPSRDRVADHMRVVLRAFEHSEAISHRAPGGEPADIVPREPPDPSWRELVGFLDTDEGPN